MVANLNTDRASYQDLRLHRVPKGFRGRNKIVVQLWWIIQASLFAWSPQIFYGWRRFLLRLFAAKIIQKSEILSKSRKYD